MTPEYIAQQKALIDKMTQTEMAELWRFAPVGHIYFDQQFPLYEYFRERFKGFTPSISKEIGHGR